MTAARLADELFYIVSGTGFRTHDFAWIRDHIKPGLDAELVDVTEELGTLSLFGPRARDVLTVLTGDDVSSRLDSWPPRGGCQALAIIRPANTAEVSSVIKLCHQQGQAVVTHGGMTGLVSGAKAGPGELALSLERMNGMNPVDTVNRTVTVQAGVALQTVQEAAEECDGGGTAKKQARPSTVDEFANRNYVTPQDQAASAASGQEYVVTPTICREVVCTVNEMASAFLDYKTMPAEEKRNNVDECGRQSLADRRLNWIRGRLQGIREGINKRVTSR